MCVCVCVCVCVCESIVRDASSCIVMAMTRYCGNVGRLQRALYVCLIPLVKLGFLAFSVVLSQSEIVQYLFISGLSGAVGV